MKMILIEGEKGKQRETDDKENMALHADEDMIDRL
jgi:hypothetical protein